MDIFHANKTGRAVVFGLHLAADIHCCSGGSLPAIWYSTNAFDAGEFVEPSKTFMHAHPCCGLQHLDQHFHAASTSAITI